MIQVQVQCCFTSTETIRTTRDGEPRTATFTQLLSSDILITLYPSIQCQVIEDVTDPHHDIDSDKGDPSFPVVVFVVGGGGAGGGGDVVGEIITVVRC